MHEVINYNIIQGKERIFIKLTFQEYKDKMMACWLGKNIGGVLGAPFEGQRGVFNVEFYTQDLKGNPPANDDLDLQLVWLNAVERYGHHVNASILGEYWLSYITPNWVEYGSGKNNLKMGLLPPLSGFLENTYRDSNGCFIRSEIWACLAPGRPELAARYAYEDAIVDHAGEGLYAEIFCATVQSAAFVERDIYKLIDIGLSYIPENCGVAKGIKTAIDAYQSGVDFKEARKKVLTAVPSTFGLQHTPLKEVPEDDITIGKPGYDAPSNIGIIIIGWLYGEGDFSNSLCIANNCGEDTDCTCATLGAILGIINGTGGIPEKWLEPIGDVISVGCINELNGGISIPKTVTELRDRILRVIPSFLGPKICDILTGTEGYTLEVLKGDDLYCPKGDLYIPGINGNQKSTEPEIPELLQRAPYAVSYKFPTFDVVLDYMGEPYFKLNQGKKLKLTLTDSSRLDYNDHKWFNLKWYLPEGVEILPAKEGSFLLQATYKNKVELEFEIMAENPKTSKLEFLIDISVNGRHSNASIKGILLQQF